MIDTAAPAHVLVVDDETVLAGMVANYLQRAGFRTSVAHDGIRAVELALAEAPDVVVLDLGLPGRDGLEVCREIRRHSDCYILMLTARNEEIDKLVGLSSGADDYMTKPFSARELVARVQVLLRRPRADRVRDEPSRLVGTLRLDPAGRRVWVNQVEVELTRTEFDVLDVLSARPKAAFTRRQLVDAVWGEDWVGDEHLVDVHIGHLRRKLVAVADLPFVDTVRGVGYRMGPAQ
ncbi:MAG TPA: response regulator transcription factor [Propionicimonas sp.]|nr:response regulator transcription factor [Propionicimonas sp.]HRA05400.1 response regulator transcription factor [Propionicimonas sp.]